MAAAIVPEPCFWTPDMPQIYQAIVELRQAGNVVARAERIVGMRTLGATGRKLFYDGKRWVLRRWGHRHRCVYFVQLRIAVDISAPATRGTR